MSSSSSKKVPNYLKPTLSQSSRQRSPEKKKKIIPKLFTNSQSIPDQPFFTASLETSPEEEYHHHQSISHLVSSSSESSLQASPSLQKTLPVPAQDHVKPKHSKTKMRHTKVRSFKGLKDGKEDPQEFLEDLEWSYQQDFESHEPATQPEKDAYISKTYRILFRQNLDHKARSWYQELDVDVKQDWELLKEKFKAAFQLTLKDAATKKFELRIKLSQLEQKDGESISDFIERAEELATRLPADDIDVGMATLKGMKDELKRDRITFECNKDADYSFSKIKKLVAAAYNEVGKISPFDPGYKEAMQVSLTGSTTSVDDLLRQVLINTNAAFPALLQGMRSLNTAVTSGVTVHPSSQPVDSRAKAYRPKLEEIKCFKCNEMGHYASNCPTSYQPPAITARVDLNHYDYSLEEEPPTAGRMVLLEEEYPVRAAARPVTRTKAQPRVTTQPAGVLKSKNKVQRRQNDIPEQILEDDAEMEESQEIEDLDQPTHYLEENTNLQNVGDPPKTRVSKTGKIQELVRPKEVKVPEPIRGMVGHPRFDVNKILKLPIEMTVGEFLDRSEVSVKELAYNLQKSIPKYRIRKPKPAKAGNNDDTFRTSTVLAASNLPPVITARAYEDDGQSMPLMVTSWIGGTRLPKTLLDGGSLIELISKKSVDKLQPRPRIYTDGHIRVSLANDTLTTLDKYVKLAVNIEGVECVVKAWMVNVEVYDLLLGVGWMRRVHFNTHYGEGKITISGNDMITRRIPAQIVPIEAGLPTIEMDEEDEMSADEACQYILDDQENDQL